MKAYLVIGLGICLAAQSALAFTPATVDSTSLITRKWTGGSVAIKFNATHGSNIAGSDADVTSVVSSAIATWATVSNVSLTINNGGTTADTAKNTNDGQNTVLFADSAAQSELGGALAVTFSRFSGTTGAMQDADVVFTTSQNFFTTTLVSDQFHLQSVLTHELGHLLGLDHSSVLGATMFQSTPAGVRGAHLLSEDDLCGIRTTYPGGTALGTFIGRVRKGSAGVLGASVFAVDTRGIVWASALTQDAEGAFGIRGLPTGTYALGVEPLDGPMQQTNVGGFWRQIGTFDTAFQTRAPSGSFSVTAGQTTDVGDLSVTGGTPGLDPEQVLGITEPGATSFSFGTLASIVAGTTGKQLLIVHTGGVDADTTVTLGGSDVTLGAATSGTFQGGTTFRRFDLTVPSSAVAGLRTVLFTKGADTAAMVGGFEVTGGTPPAANSPPAANAGPDLTVTPGVSAALNGTATDADGDPLTYSWAVTTQPVGGNAVLSNAFAAAASFSANQSGSYVVTLTVTDGRGGTGIDTAGILVNTAPIANAGTDRGLDLPQGSSIVVTLSGTGTDPDGGGITAYQWSRAGGTGPSVTLSTPTSPTTTLQVSVEGTYTFQLQVTDVLGATGSASVTLTVTKRGAPTANAGADQSFVIQAGSGISVQLSGSGTDPDGDAITAYSWTRAGGTGPEVTLSDAAAATPTFVTATAGTYTFSLRVTDARGETSSNQANVTITIAVNRPPVADAGTNQSRQVQEGETIGVTLSGSGTDPDGDAITVYDWSRAGGSGPAVVLADPSSPSPSFVPTVSGTYTFSLVVSDARGGVSTNTATVTADITVNRRPLTDAGPNQSVFINESGSVFVALSGSASDPDGDAIATYAWTRDGGTGPAVVLSNPSSRAPNFTATEAGTYIFALTATDGRGGTSLASQVTITVGTRFAPLADAGRDRRVTLRQGQSATVTLTGSGADPDGDPIVGYSWTRAGGSGPPVNLDNPLAATPSFVTAGAGTYAFTLAVTDNTGSRSTNDPIVVITVDQDTPPVANAGSGRTLILSPGGTVSVTLSGSGSDPDGDPIVAYLWTRAGGTGPAITLQGADSASPSFTTSATGTYIFSLVVTDATGGSSVNSAQVTVTVNPDQLPAAVAGPDKTVVLGLGGAVRVQLSGSGSDPDGDAIAGYFWQRSGGTGPTVSLSDDRSAAPTFFAVTAGTYVFSLTVTDSRGGVSNNLSLVTVSVVAGQRPVASAGANQTVIVNEGSATLVELSGGGVDPEGRPIVRYSWTRTGGTGPDVTLSDPTIRNPRFTVVIAGTYSFGLTVFNDIDGASANAAIVTVTAGLNRLPQASVGPAQTVFLPTGGSVTVTLSGSASDPDGDAITGYSWTRSGGTGPAVTLSDPAATSPTFVVDQPGTYVFALEVTDARGGRSSNAALSSVAIEQNGRPAANAGPDQVVVLQEESTALVTLAGSGSDPESSGALTYLWTRAGGTGPAVTLSSATTAAPSFTVSEPGSYLFGLTVTDARGAPSTNAASVTIGVVLNRRPVVTAGLGQTIRLVEGNSARVTLSGEALDPDGDSISGYSWTRAGGTGPVVTLDNAGSSSPAFTASVAGTYVFSVVATDARAGRSTNLATEAVEVLVNRRPVASAGPSVRVTVQDGQVGEVTLDGSATDPDGDAVSVYAWRRAGGTGPAVTLLDSTGPAPRFIAEVPGTYTFGLVVTDARGAGSASESLVTLTVDVNRRPAVSVGGDLEVLTGRPLTLDASAFDPDGDRLLYSWALVSGPSLTVPATSAAQISVQPASPGLYVFECAADDGRGGFDKDQVAISAAAPPQARLAPVSVTPGALRVRANQLLAVNADLTNAGRATSLTAVIRFVLSADSSLDRTDPILGRTSVGPLAPGEVRNVRGNFPVLATLAPGDYQVGVITDEVSFDAGADPASFSKLSPGPVTVEAANLIASSVSAPTQARSGDVFAVGATVENGGNVDVTTPFRVDFLLSVDRVSDVADLAVGGVLVSRLGASALTQLSAELAIPEGTPSGSYFVLASADTIGLVADPVRADNLAASVSAVAVSTPATVAFAVSLAQGARLVSLPFRPSTTDGSAFTVGQLLVDGSGRPDRGMAGRVAGAKFESFVQGTGQAPFAVEGGRGYVLTRTAAAAALSLVGRDWPSTSLRLRLERGANLIGIPAIARSTLRASDLVELTGAAHVVRSGPSGGFEIFLPDVTTDFTLQRGAAYLLSVPAAKTVTLPAE
ncbi:MAG: PKD domain-containing protein [Candidatus Wallbacteria bacterium]|nr:PKD domain-containing protein [Candidatus Wallbacteria bacterium]